MVAQQQSSGTFTDAVRAVGAHRVVAALTDGGGPARRDEWLAVVGDCQGLINVLTAVQDQAAAEVARRESVWLEDGTLGEVTHGPGRVTLDAADVLAPLLGASHAQAQRRVEQAVRVAAARGPGGGRRLGATRAERARRVARGDASGSARRLPGGSGGPRAGGVPRRGLGRRGGSPRSTPRGRRANPASAGSSDAGPHLARAPAPARDPRPGGDRPAPVGGRARGRCLARHLPQRGRRRGLGRDRPPRP